MDKIKIAIIGGGASCALLLANLARHGGPDTIHVDVFDRTGRFGRGVAYSTPHAEHLLNVRAGNMSAFAADKDDFAVWAGARGYDAASFVPRVLFGEYLMAKIAEAKKKIKINFIEEDILSSRRVGEGYILQGGIQHGPYDRAILASGNVRALRPGVKGEVAAYFEDPWRVDFSKILKTESIALVGSGLTAVDMMVALKAQSYQGNIIIYSRNALLPAVHVLPVPYPSFLGGERLSPLALLRKVRREIKDADAPWQAVIDSLRPHTNAIWQGWSDAERRVFMKRLLTFWNVHRHRMAPEIAAIVDDLRKEGRLRFVRAQVLEIAPGPVVVCKGRADKVDAVINCLGYRYDEPGRDFDVSAKIGPARFGELFETTAIPEIRAQAAEFAAVLLP